MSNAGPIHIFTTMESCVRPYRFLPSLHHVFPSPIYLLHVSLPPRFLSPTSQPSLRVSPILSLGSPSHQIPHIPLVYSYQKPIVTFLPIPSPSCTSDLPASAGFQKVSEGIDGGQ